MDYKKCLHNEIYMDTLSIYPKKLKYENHISVFYKKQRTSFQPKFTVYIEIGQKHLLETFLYGSYNERLDIQVHYLLFCEYIELHMIETFPEQFYQGDKFTCYLSSDYIHLLIFFESLTVKEGQEKIYFDELKKFEDPSMFDSFRLENMKNKIKNQYNDFSSFSSLDYAIYKFTNIIDRNVVDREEGKEYENIKKIIDEKNPKSLSKIAKQVFHYSSFNVVIIGNYKENKSWDFALKMKKNFNYQEHNTGMDRKMVLSKLINKPDIGTNVLRLQNPFKEEKNNVYLSYFFVGVLSKTMRIALRVLIHFFDIQVFKVLRTNLNLGYVAQAVKVDHYQREGILLTLQGINFEPHNVEQIVNKMILDFIEILREKEDSDIIQTAKEEFDKILFLKGNLDTTSEKIFENYQFFANNGETISYYQALNKFEPNMVLSLATKIFTEKKFQRRYIIEIFTNLTDEIKEFKMNPKYGIIKGKGYTIKELKDFFNPLGRKKKDPDSKSKTQENSDR